MNSFKTANIVLFFVLLISSISFAGELREKFEKTLPLERNGRFTLSNTNGSIHLTSWNRDEVKIEAEKIAKANREEDAQRLLDATEIVIRDERDDIDVDTRTPKSRDSFWRWIFDSGKGHVVVNYWITVPEEIYLRIKSVNGKIKAREISGHAELETTNGGVDVQDAVGSVSAETTNGGIDISLREVDREESMRFATTNGSIVAEFPDDFSAKLSARTTNGRIRCDFDLNDADWRSRRSLDGSIGRSDGGRVSFRTTNGSISIRRR